MLVEPIENKSNATKCCICSKDADVKVIDKHEFYYYCRSCLNDAPIILARTRKLLYDTINQFKSKNNE